VGGCSFDRQSLQHVVSHAAPRGDILYLRATTLTFPPPGLVFNESVDHTGQHSSIDIRSPPGTYYQYNCPVQGGEGREEDDHPFRTGRPFASQTGACVCAYGYAGRR
jgi:hypothetical protein